MILMLALTICIIPIFLYYTYRFTKIYKLSYKCILMYLLTANLSLISRIVQIANHIHFNFGKSKDHCKHFPSSACQTGFLFSMPLFFMISSVMFSFFNWIYQSQEIKQYLRRSMKAGRRIIDVLLGTAQAIILVFLLVIIVVACGFEEKVLTEDLYFMMFTVCYFIVSTVFILVGRYYYQCLKKFSPVQAKQMKKRVVLSVMFISGPMYLRGVENLIRFVVDRDRTFIEHSLHNNTFGYPLFIISFYILGDLIPITTMMISMKTVINHYYQSLQCPSSLLLPPKSQSTLSRTPYLRSDSFFSNSFSKFSRSDSLRTSSDPSLLDPSSQNS
ncbi:unnamed protein product [Moneuplotes crassus]|uniref:Uncharacterized protein n=1 Tax=Euplotes crassus TaxID=5936 RepID=A0AAD2CWB8_EUPCR|nr:unnamed protein product [Moneuplotes crassus]